MIRDSLIRVANDFLLETQKPMKGSSFQHFVSVEIPELFNGIFSYGMNYVSWRASVGLGRWSEIPWIAALDGRVTSTTQAGFYVVLLYSVDCEELYLGMQLGTENLRKEYGAQQSRLIMADKNAEITSFVDSAFPNHTFQNIRPDLQGKSQRTNSYEDAFSIGTYYHLNELPEETVLRKDISSLLQIYQALVAAYLNGETLQEQGDEPIAETQPLSLRVTEKAQYKIHKSYERNSRAAREAKRFHGFVCQGCGFDFEAFYGELGKGYIEAHHVIPLSQLLPGEQLQYNVETDFVVLCSNCHSIVHRQMPPISIPELRKIIHLKRAENNR
jgi:5-methylcytosine-specific restriction protein A